MSRIIDITLDDSNLPPPTPEIAQERKLFEQLGVVFDSNPNQTTKAGDAPAVRGLQVDSPDDLGIVLPGGDDGQEDD